MEKNENIKKLVGHCSEIINLLLKKDYLSDSINHHKFEQLKKILEARSSERGKEHGNKDDHSLS